MFYNEKWRNVVLIACVTFGLPHIAVMESGLSDDRERVKKGEERNYFILKILRYDKQFASRLKTSNSNLCHIFKTLNSTGTFCCLITLFSHHSSKTKVDKKWHLKGF